MFMETSREQLEKMVVDVIENAGFEFVEMKLVRHGKHHAVRVFADRPGGITLDQCGVLSRTLERKFDEIDLFESAYTIEVSSPGLDRPLVTPADFRRKVGEKVRLQLKVPLDERHQIEGRLVSMRDNMLVVETAAGLTEVLIDQVERGKIVF